MELIFAILIVLFFIVLNKVRVGILGEDSESSEIFIVLSTLLFGFVYSLFV